MDISILELVVELFVCVSYEDYGHQQRKYRRIAAISRVIEKRDSVDSKRFLAEMRYHGMGRSVAEKYLDVLKDLGKIRHDKGILFGMETAKTLNQFTLITIVAGSARVLSPSKTLISVGPRVTELRINKQTPKFRWTRLNNLLNNFPHGQGFF